MTGLVLNNHGFSKCLSMFLTDTPRKETGFILLTFSLIELFSTKMIPPMPLIFVILVIFASFQTAIRQSSSHSKLHFLHKILRLFPYCKLPKTYWWTWAVCKKFLTSTWTSYLQQLRSRQSTLQAEVSSVPLPRLIFLNWWMTELLNRTRTLLISKNLSSKW